MGVQDLNEDDIDREIQHDDEMEMENYDTSETAFSIEMQIDKVFLHSIDMEIDGNVIKADNNPMCMEIKDS